jgi:UDP-N-acetyl-2-amino-2-deoxyglucuronate dehydrogenase
VRIGILGAGNISDTHARAAVSIPGVEIAAVHGSNRSKTARLAGQYGATAYDDLPAFLAHRPMDAVAIGSPSGCHADQAIAAVERGLHVLIEKPVDITAARVDALIAAAADARVTVGVFFQDRLKPATTSLKASIDAGELGIPVMASGRVKWYRPPEYYSGSRWRGTRALDGGGALMNQGIHTVDLLLWLLGPVARVRGSVATRVHGIETEDTAAAILEFASGAIGVIEAATSVFPGFARRVEVTGSEGTAIIEDDDLVLFAVHSGRRDAGVRSASSPSATTPVVSDSTPHRRVFEDFMQAIRTGRPPACDAREGRRSVAVVEAVYESARTGRAITPK